jgi:predicted nucleic acid-binding Zn finger protein
MGVNQKTLTTNDEEPIVQIKGDTLQIREIPAEQFLVINQTSDTQYIVDLEDNSCTCPSHKYHDGDCKHLEAVKEAEEESEAGDIQEVDDEHCHTHEVKEIECPDCGGDAVAGQYSRDTFTTHGPNVQRTTRILCSSCGTIREEDDSGRQREI